MRDGGREGERTGIIERVRQERREKERGYTCKTRESGG